jgi:mRNA interferase HigB
LRFIPSFALELPFAYRRLDSVAVYAGEIRQFHAEASVKCCSVDDAAYRLNESQGGTKIAHARDRALHHQGLLGKERGIHGCERAVARLYRHTLHADWSSPAQVKADFRSASVLRNGRVVFNIAGNKYRLVVWINFPYRVVYVRFIGTHAQYDRIDAQTV